MPLTINVGLSRKASENYQSRGVSINVTAELDQALLADPKRLQSEVAGLYQQAERALGNQLSQDHDNGGQSDHSADDRNGRTSNGDNGRNSSSNGRDRNFRPATSSQLRALNAISDRLQTNLDDECHDEFGCPAKELGIRQASQMIDLLKERQRENGNGNGDRSRSRSSSRSGGRR